MPAPPLVVPNAVQIRLMYAFAGNGAFNVLHARKLANTVITQALANIVGAAIKSAWTTRIAPLSNGGSGLMRVGLRDLTAANQPEFLDTGATAPGSGTGDILPPNNAIAVTLRTALTGKSNRGRVYIGGFNETQNDPSGLAVSTAGTAATQFIQDVSAALTAQQMTLAVLSRPAYAYVDNRTWTFNTGDTETDVIGRGNARAGGLQDVTLIQSRNANWESQRRRANGRGTTPTAFTVVSSLEAL